MTGPFDLTETQLRRLGKAIAQAKLYPLTSDVPVDEDGLAAFSLWQQGDSNG